MQHFVGKGEANAVEAPFFDQRNDMLDRLVVQAFDHVERQIRDFFGFDSVRGPVDRLEFEALAVRVDDITSAGAERHARRGQRGIHEYGRAEAMIGRDFAGLGYKRVFQTDSAFGMTGAASELDGGY